MWELLQMMNEATRLSPPPFVLYGQRWSRCAPCWWMRRDWNWLANTAHRLGLIYRGSTTQVEWTERGAFLARQFLARQD